MNKDEHYPSYMPEEEITLKTLILKVKELFSEILRNWLLIGIICIIPIGYLLYSAFTVKPMYKADLVFMLNEEEGSSGGGLATIASRFGLSIASGSKMNFEKLISIAKSRQIVQSALFSKGTIRGNYDFYANHIIRGYGFHERWEDDTTGLANFVFKDSLPASGGSRIENRAMLAVYKQVVGGPTVDYPIMSIGYGEENSILSLSANSVSEELSIGLAHVLYDKLSTFYIEKAIEPQQQTYNTLKYKADSLKAILQSTEGRLAGFEDTNRGLVTRSAALTAERLTRDKSMLTLAYGEALKNLEVADFALRSAKPVFQIIDGPISPIKPALESKTMAILIGGFLGVFLGSIFVIGRKIIRDAMRDEPA